MNLVLLLVLLAEVCLGICCWLTPEALRWIAARLLARADVIEIVRKEQTRRLQFWSAELGLPAEIQRKDLSTIAVVKKALPS